MRRPTSWLTIAAELVVLVTVLYVGASCWLSYWLNLRAQEFAGRTITVGKVRVLPPLWAVFEDVQFIQRDPAAVIAVPKVVVVPERISWADKRVWLKSVELHAPWLRTQRTAQGAFIWHGLGMPGALPPEGPAGAQPPGRPGWTLAIKSVIVLNGTVQFVDETLKPPFWASVTELLLVGGPVLVPPEFRRMSLAVQGRLIGHKQHGAPVYCSGWMNWDARALDLSCQLQPLRLAAFRPYYEDVRIRPGIYNATLSATGHVSATGNQLHGAVQLTIEELSEADISFLNRAIQAAQDGSEPRLTGQLEIAGPLDQPSQWRYELAPGNAIVQQLVNPVLQRGVAKIPVKVGEQVISVGLTTASKEIMSGIQAASRVVQESLRIVAPDSGAPPPAHPPAALPGGHPEPPP